MCDSLGHVQLGGFFERCMCIMSILELGRIIFQPVEGIVQWMQGKHLLASSKTCPSSATAMVMNNRADISDGCR